MRALGIDTSNYATSLAVVDTHSLEVVCAKKRFLPVKEGALGLRQSDAVFHHTKAMPELLREMQQEGVLAQVGVVGVSQQPRPAEGSYMPCFLAGASFAAAYATALGTAPVSTTHQQGHMAAALWDAGLWAQPPSPVLMFHVSGGTTELLKTCGTHVEQKVGESLDLFAGQAIDRLGVRLGYAFPAGVQVSALAAECTENIRPKISIKGTNCHFSGLQNQLERLLEEGKAPAYVAKYCLLAIADTLAGMLAAARIAYGNLPVVCAGGVMSSDVIKKHMESIIHNICFVNPAFSADNAVGVALIAAKEGNGG